MHRLLDVKKTIHSEENMVVADVLRTLREEAGLTQRSLAAKLEREQSFIWRIEKGERRLDVVEFYRFCQALGADPAALYSQICATFARDNSPQPVPKVAEQRKKYPEK